MKNIPNHIKNIIHLQGDKQRIHEIMETIKNDEYGIGSVDFNKIIPMPESLDITAGSPTTNGLKLYQEFIKGYIADKNTKESMMAFENIPAESEDAFLQARADRQNEADLRNWKLGKIAWKNIQQYGVPTWFEWRVDNWGTKWNAYAYDSSNSEFTFQTAWSAPHPILKKLSSIYPEVVFEHEWADEDLGFNCGKRMYSDGEIIEEYYPEGIQATDFALSIWGYDPFDLDMVKNSTGTKYIYTEYEEYKLAEVFGKHVLFTKEKLTAEDIPQGMYCYYLSKAEQKNLFVRIDWKASFNYGGSIITQEPLDFDGKDHISLTDRIKLNFLDEQLTLGEYMKRAPAMEETQGFKNMEL